VTQKRIRKIKRWRLYERAVAEVFQHFDRSARISCGQWVIGPDGRRELDVLVEQTISGRALRGIVECKDFNPAKTGPVGVGYVDALESKRRDVGADFSMICSNAGFTADAIRKARRVGIGLIGAARKGDARIQFGVIEEIYIRHIRIKHLRLRLWPSLGEPALPLDGSLSSEAFTFDGRCICRWFHVRFLQTLALNPIVKGAFHDYCTLKAPMNLQWPGGNLKVDRIGMELEIEGAWFAQTVRLDATAAIYDWLRRRLRVAPGGGQVQVVGVDFFGGDWIPLPKDLDWNEKFQPHEFELKFVVLKNILEMEDPPQLDSYVAPEDLSLTVKGMGPECTESVPGFSSAKVES
jgi:Restriction endonuclease